MFRRSLRKKESGISIIIVIILLLIIIVVGLLINRVGIFHIGFVKKQRFSTRAKYAAESGTSRAIVTLKKNNSWDGTIDGSGEESKLTYLNKKMPGSDDSYTVRVYNNFKGNSEIDAFKGIKVPPGSCFILSKGQSGNIASRHVGVVIVKSSYFDYGLFADKEAKMSGDIKITAYDSSTGIDVPGGADLATNGKQKGAVTLDGSPVFLDGNIFAGYGADIVNGEVIIMRGHCTVTGDKDTLSREKYLKDVKIPKNLPHRTFTGGTLLPGDYSNEGKLKIHESDIKITGTPGGSEYIFAGIQAAGNGKLIVDATDGPVKIYITDNVTVSAPSGIRLEYRNSTNIMPEDLQIYASKDVERIKLTGVSDCYGVIYAPDTLFEMTGNSEHSGGVVAEEIKITGNAHFKYDVNLKKLESTGTLTVGSWQYF